MKSPRRNILSRLDDTLRWTGVPARVADDMSDAPSVDRKHRPLRWIPIWPIAFSCALFILSLIRQSAPNLAALVPSLGVVIVAMLPAIHMSGPLGKPSLEDDEREAALRKDSFFFCLGTARLSQLPGPTYSHDPVSLAELANRAQRKRCSIGVDAECHLVRMFAHTVCELEFAAIAERVIAPAICPAYVR